MAKTTLIALMSLIGFVMPFALKPPAALPYFDTIRGRVFFNTPKLTLTTVCENLVKLGGPDALSDGMRDAAKYFKQSGVTPQAASFDNQGMNCMYTHQIGPGADIGNHFGDYFDSAIEHPFLIPNPCRQVYCKAGLNPAVYLTQRMLQMQTQRRGRGRPMGGAMGGSMGGFGSFPSGGTMGGGSFGILNNGVSNIGKTPGSSTGLFGNIPMPTGNQNPQVVPTAPMTPVDPATPTGQNTQGQGQSQGQSQTQGQTPGQGQTQNQNQGQAPIDPMTAPNNPFVSQSNNAQTNPQTGQTGQAGQAGQTGQAGQAGQAGQTGQGGQTSQTGQSGQNANAQSATATGPSWMDMMNQMMNPGANVPSIPSIPSVPSVNPSPSTPGQGAQPNFNTMYMDFMNSPMMKNLMAMMNNPMMSGTGTGTGFGNRQTAPNPWAFF